MIDGQYIPRTILPILGDGCLFRAIYFFIYGSQEMHNDVFEDVVRFIVVNLIEFSVTLCDSNGDNVW